MSGFRSFYELFLRGGSAAHRFGNPGSGVPVHVEPGARDKAG
jgi:hypothetical protein